MVPEVIKTARAIDVLSDIVGRITRDPKTSTLGASLLECYKLSLRIEFKRCFSAIETADETMGFIQDNLKEDDLELLKTITSSFYLRTGYQNDEDFYESISEAMLASKMSDEPLPTVPVLKSVLIRYKMATVLYLLTHALYW